MNSNAEVIDKTKKVVAVLTCTDRYLVASSIEHAARMDTHTYIYIHAHTNGHSHNREENLNCLAFR